MHERVDAIVAIDTYALHAPGLDPVLVLSLMCANLPDDGVDRRPASDTSALTMVENFTHTTFSELTGELFRLLLDDGSTLDLELVSVTPAPTRPSGAARREPFSIVFRGPQEPLLPQRIYPFESESLGTFELFIVPIGPDESGMQYEAVFG